MKKDNTDPQLTRQLILMVTLQCNLNCSYCYEKHKCSRKMSLAMAREILGRELTTPGGHLETRDFIIDFFGGEPLMNYGLVHDVCEWLWKNEWKYPYKLRIRTNGTLLNEEMKRWFREHRDRIELALSLDGLGEMQRTNRTEIIPDAHFFRDNWPETRTKLVLFPDTVHLLSEAICGMREEKIPFEVEIGSGIVWSDEKAGILEEQLERLIPSYVLDMQEAFDSKLFPTHLADLFPENPPMSYPFCGCVSNIVAYDTDGKNYCCHMFTPVVLGEELAGKAVGLCTAARTFKIDEKCRMCPLVDCCRLCYGDNLRVCGDMAKSAALGTTCKAVKAMARATAKLYLENLRIRLDKKMEISEKELDAADKACRLLKHK